jgi:hypothetical protein
MALVFVVAHASKPGHFPLAGTASQRVGAKGWATKQMTDLSAADPANRAASSTLAGAMPASSLDMM